jgi:hypothetical protein
MTKQPPLQALAVAYLTAQGRRQKDIAQILNISQAAVSRLYKEVKDVYIETKFREDQVDQQILEQIRRMAAPEAIGAKLKALAEVSGNPGPIVYRIPTAGEYPVEEFASAAAAICKELLSRARATVGVAWGNTIWHVSQALRVLPPQSPWRQQSPIEFVPLCGDPLMDSVEVYADRTSSRIASELSKTVNGDVARRPAWLGLVPAFIPRNTFADSELRVIDRLIDLVPQYGRIFGARVPSGTAKQPTAADLDMILTAAGSAEHPVGFGQSPLLKLESKEAKILTENIFGDIGGVLVPKPRERRGTESATHPLVQELTRHWTGLKMEHLSACSARAFHHGGALGDRPGVVLLGFGADRAPVVVNAVRRGLVNHLVLGTDLESAVLALLCR